MATDEIRVTKGGAWEWFIREDITKEIRLGITGKYLFFSSNRALLTYIATDELLYNDFHAAKVVLPGCLTGIDFVLCLYSKDDSRRDDLAKRYRGMKNLKYRYWKSEEATLADMERERRRREDREILESGLLNGDCDD